MWMIGVYIGIGAFALVTSMAVAVAFLFFHWKKEQSNISSKNTDLELQHLNLSIVTTSEKKISFDGSIDGSVTGRIKETAHTTPRKKNLMETFTSEELKKGTENFSSSNLIEDSVYLARLNGKDMAIKRISTDLVSKIDFRFLHNPIHHHPNLIRLLGACVTESPNSYLVYEYANNGSLKDWLHSGLATKSHFIASCSCNLTWNQRLRICLDVATSLQFMHHVMNPPYVHTNIKSRNIFLDEELSAKVGNFGMPRCVDDESGHEKGDFQLQRYLSGPGGLPVAYWSKGYIAPEYLEKGVISTGTDVFAYGIVLLEILSGKTPITIGNDLREVWLNEKIKSVLASENAQELRDWIDNALGDDYSFDAAVTMANLARACVEEEPSLRPNAVEIVEKVSRLMDEMPPQGDEFSIAAEGPGKPLFKAAASPYRTKE